MTSLCRLVKVNTEEERQLAAQEAEETAVRKAAVQACAWQSDVVPFFTVQYLYSSGILAPKGPFDSPARLTGRGFQQPEVLGVY